MKKMFSFLCVLLCVASPVSAASYDLLYPFQNGYARAVTDLKWGLLNEDLSEAVPATWDFIGELYENRRFVKKQDLYGFLDEQNREVIQPAYAQTGNFAEGLCCVKNSEGLWGYIDDGGNLVIPFMYEDANGFSCGRALVKTEGLYGYIDKTNQFVIPATYQEAYSFYDDRACIGTDNGYGYIDPSGDAVIPAIYELAFDFWDGVAIVKDGGYGLIDTDGNYLLDPTHGQLSLHTAEGFVKETQGGKTSMIDYQGVKWSKSYDVIGDFSEDFCPVKIDGHYGYIDNRMELVIPAEWEYAGAFSEGFAPVGRDGLYGYIDTKGTLATELIYTDIGKVSAGYGSVQTAEGDWQFIKPTPFVSSYEDSLDDHSLLLRISDNIMHTPKGDVVLDAAPILHEGYTMLPIRQVVEAIGGTVDWNAENQEITARYNLHVVSMNLGQTGAFVSGRFTILDQAPMLYNERTLVPLRFAVESLGCEVEWEPTTQEILITYP